MSEGPQADARPTDQVGRVLYSITRALAIFGGVLCCVIAVVVSVSVTGRYLVNTPIPGDYEIAGILGGTAVFSFLPFCQLVRGNVVVDFFTSSAPPRVKAFLDAVGSLLFLGVAVLFTWRLYHGALDLYRDQEVIAAFTFYRWWTLPFDILCMILLILVVAYTLFRDIGGILGSETQSPQVAGQE